MPVSLKYPTLGKNLGKKKTIFLDSLEEGGASQDSLKIVFFVFSTFFFGFGHFQPSATFVHWPFGGFMRSSLQEPIVSPLQL